MFSWRLTTFIKEFYDDDDTDFMCCWPYKLKPIRPTLHFVLLSSAVGLGL